MHKENRFAEGGEWMKSVKECVSGKAPRMVYLIQSAYESTGFQTNVRASKFFSGKKISSCLKQKNYYDH